MLCLKPWIEVKMQERKRETGIILSEITQNKLADVVVVQTFEGCETCKPNDILILKPKGERITYRNKENNENHFIAEQDIIAVERVST